MRGSSKLARVCVCERVSLGLVRVCESQLGSARECESQPGPAGAGV